MRIFRRRGAQDENPSDDVAAWFIVAQQLQRDDPDQFNTMLARLEEGPEGIEAQRTKLRASEEDIEAVAVASLLCAAEEKGVLKPEPGSDRDYWPTLDLEAIHDRLAEEYRQKEAEAGGPLAYPEWAIRRIIAFELLATAGLNDFKVSSDLQSILESSHHTEEDPAIDEAVDRLLRKHHLTESFQILFDSFTAPLPDV